MLGIFMFLNLFEFARDRYSEFQERMQQFLDEIDAGFQIPISHKDFRDNFTSLYKNVLCVLTEKEDGRNVALFRPFVLGFGFMAIALNMPNEGIEGSVLIFDQRGSLNH
jgi:hypothetical protein